jgi:glutamate-1-semialdehyde 2,1-aminomutase
MSRAAVVSRSAALVEHAEELFPGGVNSPVRAFRAVGRPPLVLERGEGPYVWDADHMDLVAPSGPVYQAGTLSGHPLSMAAGIATLAELHEERYMPLEASAAALASGLTEAATTAGREVAVARIGSLLTVFFRPPPPVDAAEALASDREAYARFFRAMLDQGILLPPSQFEAWFVSMGDGPEEIEATLDAARTALVA